MDTIYGIVNARHVQHYQSPPLLKKFTLPYYYTVAESLLRGPEYLLVIQKPGAREKAFERIVHLTRRVPNTSRDSWSIFKPDCTWKHGTKGRRRGVVLRHARWHVKEDMATRAWQQRELPTMSTCSWFVAESNCDQIISVCTKLDTLLQHGVPVSPRTTSPVAWSELGVFGVFDWGTIDLTWPQSRESVALEEIVPALAEAIVQTIQQHRSTGQVLIDTIKMVYPIDPDFPVKWSPSTARAQ